MAAAVDRAMAASPASAGRLDTDGAARTAELVTAWAADRDWD
jgi:hypothetical protein